MTVAASVPLWHGMRTLASFCQGFTESHPWPSAGCWAPTKGQWIQRTYLLT